MFFNGSIFTNNGKPRVFRTAKLAATKARSLIKRFKILRDYRVWIDGVRFSNPSSREEGLDTAENLLREFTGHDASKVVKATISNQREGLVVGELDLIGYRVKRDGVNHGHMTRYAHQFRKNSRPLLAVTKDGKQLHIVGGRYEFTEAGIEDR